MATTEDFSVVQTEGKGRVRRALKRYNPDDIVSSSYQANCKHELMAHNERSASFGNPRGEVLEGFLENIEQTIIGEPQHRIREEARSRSGLFDYSRPKTKFYLRLTMT